jgi:hypothetical protein
VVPADIAAATSWAGLASLGSEPVDGGVVRARPAVPVVLALAGLLVLAGCTSDASSVASDRSPGSAGPVLGAAAPRARTPPRQSMDRLERPIAERLARQVAGQGLTLRYLDCPRWGGAVPSVMTCRGYLDGVVGVVRVELDAAVRGRAVSFEARLTGGVIATRMLERTLRQQGADRADCGRTVAYPARVGAHIVCRVTRGGADRYVVATVADRSGAVTIADYRRAGAGR